MANGDNSLGVGQAPVNMLGPDVAPRAVTGFLKQQAEALWPVIKNVVMGPGEVYSGELQPSMTPGPNQLSVPEYALGLTGLGLGVGTVPEMVAGTAGGPAVLRHFPAWHGTGVSKPFEQFEDRYLGTGEGAQIPSLVGEHAWGHYISGIPSEARGYQQSVGRYREGGGAFLSLNVKPEQHELLDWNKPFSQQSDYVQERLLKSNIGNVLADPHASIRGRNGEGLYRGVMNKIYGDYERDAAVTGADPYISTLDLKKMASQHLDSIGIPGMKYDAGGYGAMPGGEHFMYTGDSSVYWPDAVSNYMYDDPEEFHSKFIAPAKGDVGKAVDSLVSDLEDKRDTVQHLNDTGEDPSSYDLNRDPNHYDYAAQWLKNNRDDFKIFGGATPNNYVIFNGRHLDITHWDGNNMRSLFPVDHDPFGGEEVDWRLPSSQQMYVNAPKELGNEGVTYSYKPPEGPPEKPPELYGPQPPSTGGWTPEPMYPYDKPTPIQSPIQMMNEPY